MLHALERYCRARAVDGCELLSIRSADHHACLGPATVHADHDLAHFQRSSPVGAGWVNDERIPTTMVMLVPMSTYHGHAIRDSDVRVSLNAGNTGVSCLAKTTTLMMTIAVAIPSIASR